MDAGYQAVDLKYADIPARKDLISNSLRSGCAHSVKLPCLTYSKITAQDDKQHE